MEENGVRKKIRFFVTRDPGIRFQELRQCTGVNESTLRYHIGYLLRKGELRVDSMKGEKRIFPSSDLKRSKMAKEEVRVLQAVEEEPGITLKELIVATNLKKRELSSILRKRVNQGMIIAFKDMGSGEKRYMDPCVYVELRFKDLVKDLVSGKISESQFLKERRKLEEIKG